MEQGEEEQELILELEEEPNKELSLEPERQAKMNCQETSQTFVKIRRVSRRSSIEEKVLYFMAKPLKNKPQRSSI